jgi:hypothetical protein
MNSKINREIEERRMTRKILFIANRHATTINKCSVNIKQELHEDDDNCSVSTY